MKNVKHEIEKCKNQSKVKKSKFENMVRITKKTRHAQMQAKRKRDK